MFFPCARIAGGDGKDTVGINEEADFNPSEAGWHRIDALEIEPSQTAAVFREFTFALHYMDQNIGLAIHTSSKGFAGAGRNGRVAVDDFRSHAAIHLDPEREGCDVEE